MVFLVFFLQGRAVSVVLVLLTLSLGLRILLFSAATEKTESLLVSLSDCFSPAALAWTMSACLGVGCTCVSGVACVSSGVFLGAALPSAGVAFISVRLGVMLPAMETGDWPLT